MPVLSREQAEVLEALTDERIGALPEGTAAGVVEQLEADGLLEPARRMAEWAADLERAAERADKKPRGVVRITAPPGVAFEFVAPFAVWLRKKLPEVELEVVSTVQYLDLARRAGFQLVERRGIFPTVPLLTRAIRKSPARLAPLHRLLTRLLPVPGWCFLNVLLFERR